MISEYPIAVPRSSRTTVIRSPEENEKAVQRLGVKQRVRQLGRGTFRSALAFLRTGESILYCDRFKSSSLLSLEPPRGSVALIVPRCLDGHILACGDRVANDKLSVVPAASGIDLVLPAWAGTNTILLPESRIIELAMILCPSRHPGRLRCAASVSGNTPRLRALSDRMKHLVAQPDSASDPELAENLIAAMIVWLAESSNRWHAQGFNGNGYRGRVAKRTQEYLEGRHHEAIRIENLCRVTGVGVRTLQRCFREYFNVTITEYLKAVRFAAARRELAVAHPAESSVTNIAMENGLSHLGRFSVEYRQRFGESPRETLARRATAKA